MIIRSNIDAYLFHSSSVFFIILNTFFLLNLQMYDLLNQHFPLIPILGYYFPLIIVFINLKAGFFCLSYQVPQCPHYISQGQLYHLHIQGLYESFQLHPSIFTLCSYHLLLKSKLPIGENPSPCCKSVGSNIKESSTSSVTTFRVICISIS